MRKINFSAGPSTLPLEILEQAQKELCDYQGKGYSIMEIFTAQKYLKKCILEHKRKLKTLRVK